MSRFTRKPKAAVEDFIAGAETRNTPSNDMESYHSISKDNSLLPWQDPKVRDDLLKVYNLRLPEPYLLKLKYIAEHTPDSMQKFCLELLLPAIDARIKQLTEDQR